MQISNLFKKRPPASLLCFTAWVKQLYIVYFNNWTNQFKRLEKFILQKNLKFENQERRNFNILQHCSFCSSDWREHTTRCGLPQKRPPACRGMRTNGVSQPLTGNICGTPFNIATVFRWFCTIHLLDFDKGKELLY